MLGRLGHTLGVLPHRALVPREVQQMHSVLGRAEASLSPRDVLQLTSPAPPLGAAGGDEVSWVVLKE